MFYVVSTSNNIPNPDYKINTVVKCYDNYHGNSLNFTTTSPTFRWGDYATAFGSPDFYFSSHWKEFSCLDLPTPPTRN